MYRIIGHFQNLMTYMYTYLLPQTIITLLKQYMLFMYDYVRGGSQDIYTLKCTQIIY